MIYIPGAAADRLKCVWGPDAEVWRPERWLEGGGLPESSHMNAGYARLLAFSQGARACIGVRLAVYQVKVCVMSADKTGLRLMGRLLVQFTIFRMIRTFKVNDTGVDIVRKTTQVILAPQPFVRGREAENALIPVELVLLE